MTKNWIAAIARLVSGVQARWTGCPPDQKQRVYFANHTSNLDALVLWAVLPSEVRTWTRPVAARDYWITNRIRRYLANDVFNAVLIDRKSVTARNNPIHALLEALGDKHSLILFPEGGRQSRPEIGEFKSGLFHLARKRQELELVPTYIENLNRILPKGEVLPVPVLSSVTFGAPIRLDAGEEKKAFLGRARQSIIDLADL